MTNTSKAINDNHGEPYDRGRADSYYERKASPHHRRDGVEVPILHKTDAAGYREYWKGYNDNEDNGCHKDWY